MKNGLLVIVEVEMLQFGKAWEECEGSEVALLEGDILDIDALLDGAGEVGGELAEVEFV